MIRTSAETAQRCEATNPAAGISFNASDDSESLQGAGKENIMADSFKKGGKPGPGRPKGCKNKTTQTALEAIAQAAEELGGATRLVEWAKEAPENEKVFWGTIYPKLLPLQVTGEGGGAVVLHLLASDADL